MMGNVGGFYAISAVFQWSNLSEKNFAETRKCTELKVCLIVHTGFEV